MEEVVGALLDGAQVLHEVCDSGDAVAAQQLLQPRPCASAAHPQRLRPHTPAGNASGSHCNLDLSLNL